MKLAQQISYFEEHQKELVKKHHGKFVLIYDGSVHGFYDSALDAHTGAVKRGVEPGTFLIRQCLRPEEEVTPVFHSRVA